MDLVQSDCGSAGFARCARGRGARAWSIVTSASIASAPAVRPDRAGQGASISTGSETAMKPDSSRTPDPHQPDQPDDTSGESASTPAEGDDPGAEEMIPDYPDADVQNRLWLNAVVPLLSFVPTRLIPAGAFSLPSTRCTSRRASESPASSAATFRPARADCRTSPRVARRRGGRFPISRKTPGIISQTFQQGPSPHAASSSSMRDL